MIFILNAEHKQYPMFKPRSVEFSWFPGKFFVSATANNQHSRSNQCNVELLTFALLVHISPLDSSPVNGVFDCTISWEELLYGQLLRVRWERDPGKEVRWNIGEIIWV